MSADQELPDSDTVELSITMRLGLTDLRSAKELMYRVCDLVDDYDVRTIDGLLNLLDCIQDAIVDQGLATEQDVFGPEYGKDDSDDGNTYEC